MIRPRIPSGPPPKPLDADELARILAWQRQMYWFYGIAMALITAGFLAITRFSETTWMRPLLLVMIIGLMIAGAFVQFRERCPRCQTLLGRQSRFILAAKCNSCGVAFPRGRDADHAPRA
jgi:predicted cobalt transporter CbtA